MTHIFKKINLIPFLAFVAIVIIPSCNKAQSSTNDISCIMENDSIPKPIKQLVAFINANDSIRFANLVSYPLERPYPLPDILSANSMQNYYSILIDDSIKNLIISSSPDQWINYSWRGWTLDNGQYLWIDDNVYSIPYISKRENLMRDSLISIDLGSLPESLRKECIPLACFKIPESGKIYRVDLISSAPETRNIRLAIYNSPNQLRRIPSRIIFGQKMEDGSAPYYSYHFPLSDNRDLIYSPDISDDSEPTLTITDKNGNEISRQIAQPSYWVNLLSTSN